MNYLTTINIPGNIEKTSTVASHIAGHIAGHIVCNGFKMIDVINEVLDEHCGFSYPPQIAEAIERAFIIKLGLIQG